MVYYIIVICYRYLIVLFKYFNIFGRYKLPEKLNRKPLPDQADVLVKVSCGDEVAFRQLYEHYSIAVYRVAYRYLRSVGMAEDIVQEIFLVIWDKRRDFKEIRALENYLVVMTRNLCLKHMKELAKESTAYLEYLQMEHADEADSSEDYQALLNHAIQALPPQQKRVIELAKIQGMSHEKIARLLNLSAHTVNNHITAALKSIKLRLQRYTIVLAYLVASLLH